MKTLTLVVCLLLSGQVLSSQDAAATYEKNGKMLADIIAQAVNGYKTTDMEVLGKRYYGDNAAFVAMSEYTDLDTARILISMMLMQHSEISVLSTWAKMGHFFSMYISIGGKQYNINLGKMAKKPGVSVMW